MAYVPQRWPEEGPAGLGVDFRVALRRIALLTLLAFGCATVRVPVTASDEPAEGAGVSRAADRRAVDRELRPGSAELRRAPRLGPGPR